MFFKKLKTHDIFISYVVEDREIVNSLVKGLKSKGLRVWYAHEQLKMGTSIRDTIDSGLEKTRYALIVISAEYTSFWAYGELNRLFSDKGTKKILPILHNIEIEDIALKIPGIHDIYCRNSKIGIEKIISEISERIERRSPFYYSFIDVVLLIKRKKQRVLQWVIILLLAVLSFSFYLQYKSRRPSYKTIQAEIEKRIVVIENLSGEEFKLDISEHTAEKITLENAMSLAKEANRNNYEFYNGIEYISTLTALKNENIIPPTGPILVPFGIEDARTYSFRNGNTIKVGIANLDKTSWSLIDSRLIDKGLYEVDIKYKNPIRYINIGVYTDSITNTTERRVYMWGLKPKETLVFEETEDGWRLLQVR